jgi:hypothetical protein
MKNRIILISILILGIILVGCNATQGAENVEYEKVALFSENSYSELSEYMPFLENTILEYQGIGNEFAEQTVFYEFIDGNRAQVKIKSPGTNLVKVLELKEGALTEIYREGEFYHIENMLQSKPNKSELILKEPLEVGTSWNNEDGYKSEITGKDVAINVLDKSYNALEVTKTNDKGKFQKEYYVKGIGLVARIYKDGNFEIKTLLKDIRKASLEQDVELYYPLKDSLNTIFIEDTIAFNTNSSIEKLIEDKFKKPISDELIPILPDNTSINSINLDRGEWILKVDLSENFLTEINAGSTQEYEIIRSLVNTLGRFYDTTEVYLTLAGRPYESGHQQLIEGEVFKVDVEGISKYDFN